MDHWSDPLASESPHMQLDEIYIYTGYGGHQLRLKCAQVHHHSPAGTENTGPGEVSSLITDPPGTPVIPCFKDII